MGSRDLRETLMSLLSSESFEAMEKGLCGLHPKRAVSPLLSFLLSKDALVKWRAVEAIGILVSRLAETEPEAARVIMRRLMWQLNDESGGIGWGCAEAMGEIMARSRLLTGEYAHVLRSYVDEKGNFIEYEPLQAGVLWGLGRLASVYPEAVQEARKNISAFLKSGHPYLRGLALWCLGRLNASTCGEETESVKGLLADESEIEIYTAGAFVRCKVRDLAQGLLEPLRNGSGN